MSHRAAAARFKVSAASISRWRTLERRSGDLRPGPLGGDRRSRAVSLGLFAMAPIARICRAAMIAVLEDAETILGADIIGSYWGIDP